MATTKTTYAVTTDVCSFTRTSVRTYTHVVVGQDRKTGEYGLIGFSGNFKLAVSLRKQWSVGKKWDAATNGWVATDGPFVDLRIYTVDGTRVL